MQYRIINAVSFGILLLGESSNGLQHGFLPTTKRISERQQGSNLNRQESLPRLMNNAFASCFLALAVASTTLPAQAYSLLEESSPEDVQGISAVTQSKFGQSVRGAVIGGAQIADRIDLKWERFSDSLRDEQKCDPRTNRRMFDNGTRRDGTKIGNPVLGALCTPEPLKTLDSDFATSLSKIAEDVIMDNSLLKDNIDRMELKQRENQVKEKISPAFARAITNTGSEEMKQETERQAFNRDLYVQMRVYGEGMNQQQQSYRNFEKLWGRKMLATLAPNANRNDYTSPFPKPDPTDDQPYDEASLLDALGGVSLTLNKLQEAGLIGHWEISIPEDDFWNVVTIAVDDDISIGGQILARESKLPLSGSAVKGIIRSAMEDQAKISYKMDTFFIDPTTTRQELYNPTQLLVSLSDLGQ